MGKDRRVGVALVIVAALVLAVASRVSGRDVNGQAGAVPWTTPPAVGSCLLTHETGPDSSDPTVVPCERMHTVEVIQSWRKDEQPDPDQDLCAAPGTSSPAATPPTDWTAPPTLILRMYLNGGDPLGWVACVLGPVTGGTMMQPVAFTGSLPGESSDPASAAVPVCLLDAEQQVGCADQHIAQRIGEFRTTDLTAKPLTSCHDLARRLIGPDAFGGPDPLVVRVSGSDTGGWKGASAGGFESVLWCDVTPTDLGRTLVGSVIGLGDRPIPYG